MEDKLLAVLDKKAGAVYFECGMQKINKERYQESIPYFDRAVFLCPQDAEYVHQRGCAWFHIGEFQKAHDDQEKAISLNNKEARYFFGRASVEYSLGLFEKAISSLNEAITLDPTEPNCVYSLGVIREQQGNYLGAIEDFKIAIQLRKKQIENLEAQAGENEPEKIEYLTEEIKNSRVRMAGYFNSIGRIQYQLKLYNEAIANYTQALELDPEKADYFNSRGHVKFLQQDYVGALEDYKKAAALDKNNAVYFHNRGNTEYQLKKYADAEASYTRAIELDPLDADSFSERGSARFLQKDYQGALEDYRKAVALDKNTAIIFRNCGYTEKTLKQYADAEASYTRAIELDPANTAYFNERGHTRFVQKDYLGALEDYKKAAALDKNSAILFSSCGGAERELEQYADAEASYTRAIELDPGNIAFLAERAMLYRKQGKIAECIQDLKAISPNAPQSCYANYTLGRLVEKELWVSTEGASKEEYYARAYKGYCERIEKDSKDSGAYYRLGKMYEFGRGIDQDLNKAKEHYGECIKIGNYKLKEAQARLKALEDKTNQETAKADSTKIKRTSSAELLAKFDGGVVHTSQRTSPREPSPVNNNNNDNNASAGVAPGAGN